MHAGFAILVARAVAWLVVMSAAVLVGGLSRRLEVLRPRVACALFATFVFCIEV